VVIILRKDYLPAPPAWLAPLDAKLAHENDAFRIYQIDPTPRAEGRGSPASSTIGIHRRAGLLLSRLVRSREDGSAGA
jgi:hypothetical protein